MDWTEATAHTMRGHARALAAREKGRLGIEPDDLYHTAWLAWQDASARGVSDAGCAVRARGAMLDEVRQWRGHDWDHQTGERLTTVSQITTNAVYTRPTPRQRTRLPHWLRRTLRTMPPVSRMALHGMFVEGWTTLVEADMRQCPKGTVAARRHKAITKIRAMAGAYAADTRAFTRSTAALLGMPPAPATLSTAPE